MREIGISPRFSRDKFVPLQTKQRYSTRDISGEVSLTLFFRGFVPFLSLADFVSRNKNLQVADLQRLKSCFGELVTATTSNHQHGPRSILRCRKRPVSRPDWRCFQGFRCQRDACATSLMPPMQSLMSSAGLVAKHLHFPTARDNMSQLQTRCGDEKSKILSKSTKWGKFRKWESLNLLLSAN